MRGIYNDYRRMNDPYSNDKDNVDKETLHSQYINSTEVRGNIHSLAEAWKSEKWLEWEKVI